MRHEALVVSNNVDNRRCRMRVNVQTLSVNLTLSIQFTVSRANISILVAVMKLCCSPASVKVCDGEERFIIEFKPNLVVRTQETPQSPINIPTRHLLPSPSQYLQENNKGLIRHDGACRFIFLKICIEFS